MTYAIFKAACAALPLLALPLLTQAQTTTPTTETEFQDLMVERATQAGVAALPVACAGLFRAMWLISPEDSANADALNEKHVDAAMVGITLLATQNGTEGSEETVAMVDHVSRVSTVYLDWIKFNRSNGEFLTDMIRENYTLCEGQLVEWNASLAN